MEPSDKLDSTHAIAVETFEHAKELDQEPHRGYNPAQDKRDMWRLGKRQQLKGYVVILGQTWEYAIITSIFSLSNGGTGGAIWMTFAVCVGMFFVVLSMAEAASMAPTSGGQYHWVSELSPPYLQRPLSYAVGWMSAIAWQTSMPANAYITVQQWLALAVVVNPTFVIQGWHAALLTMASVACSVVISLFVMRKLNLLEGLGVCLHICGFIAFVIIMWVMGPRAPAKEVFFTFEDANNWGSVGLATLVGLIGPAATYIGGDSAVHLAEELCDASYVLPRAMVVAAAVNYILGFVAIVTFMFNLGDVESALASPTEQPWIAVMARITGSKAAVIVLVCVVSVSMTFLQINCVMTTSRQLWSFARDKGLPFSHFLAKVNSDGVPRNAVWVTLLFACLVALIIIGSSAAFTIVLSLGTVGIYCSYIPVICCMIYRRLTDQPFPPSKFALGKFGLLVNTIALCFLTLASVMLFFPPQPEPTPKEMNWSCLMFGALLIIAFVYYLFRGRYNYEGPVQYVRKES